LDNTRIRSEFTQQLLSSTVNKEKTTAQRINTRDISHFHDSKHKKGPEHSQLEKDTKNILNMLMEEDEFILPTDIVELEKRFREK